MKKFTDWPIGLGFNHLEQEETMAHFWNHHVDNNLTPGDFVEIPSSKAVEFNRQNRETGLSLINSGFVEERNGKWRMSGGGSR